MSWSEGRYQTRQHFLNNVVTDLQGAPADIVEFPVMHPAIELRSFGLSYEGASPPSPGSGPYAGTLAQVTIDRINVADGSRDNLGTLTVELDKLDHSVSDITLDPNQDDVLVESAFPRAVQGDRIVFSLITQGDTDPQMGRLFAKYRELENRSAEVDRPTA